MILVTGGTGFIGHHVVRRLCAEGFPIRVLVRRSSARSLLESLPVDLVEGDLTDFVSLQRAVAGCSVVFHIAADYRLWAPDPKELYRNNVHGTEAMLQAAWEERVERFIYTSTVGTLDFSKNGRPATELDVPRFETLAGDYKKSKFLAEEAVFRYAQHGFPVVVVNPSAPVGEGDWKPTETGKMIVDFLNHRMPAYIDTGLSLVDVRDVAEGHVAAMRRGRVGERYILGGHNLSLQRILQILGSIAHLRAPNIRMPYKVALWAGKVDNRIAEWRGKPPRIPLEGVQMAKHKMYVSSEKAKRELGYEIHPIESALQRAVAWYRENGYVEGIQRAASK